MGTAEFYGVVERLDRIVDSLALHLEDPGGGPGELWLFVVTTPGGDDAPDGAALRAEVAAALRRDLSPRHVPDHVIAVAEIPRTLSGKKLEVPLKRILAGADPAGSLSLAALANPDSVEPFLRLAEQRRFPAAQPSSNPG
jgi:acetoacetyl-CoA synthetase